MLLGDVVARWCNRDGEIQKPVCGCQFEKGCPGVTGLFYVMLSEYVIPCDTTIIFGCSVLLQSLCISISIPILAIDLPDLLGRKGPALPVYSIHDRQIHVHAIIYLYSSFLLHLAFLIFCVCTCRKLLTNNAWYYLWIQSVSYTWYIKEYVIGCHWKDIPFMCSSTEHPETIFPSALVHVEGTWVSSIATFEPSQWCIPVVWCLKMCSWYLLPGDCKFIMFVRDF